jgi:hypothetical protein
MRKLIVLARILFPGAVFLLPLTARAQQPDFSKVELRDA